MADRDKMVLDDLEDVLYDSATTTEPVFDREQYEESMTAYEESRVLRDWVGMPQYKTLVQRAARELEQRTQAKLRTPSYDPKFQKVDREHACAKAVHDFLVGIQHEVHNIPRPVLQSPPQY